MDPLSVLREFSIDGQLDKVIFDGDRVKFGDRYSFPKGSVTGYKRHGGGLYDLHTLVYLLKVPSNPWLNYVRSAREAGVPQVAFPDRKDLLEYLTGQIDRSDKIQLTAPEFVLPTVRNDASDEPAAKKARLDNLETSEMPEKVDFDAVSAPLLGKERQLRDRNSQMSIQGKSFKQVLEILQIAQREQARWASNHARQPPLPKEKKVIPIIPSGRFDRPIDQNPKGAFKISVPGGPPLPPGPPPPPPSGLPPAPPTSKSAPRPSSTRHSHEKTRSRPSSANSRDKSGKSTRPIIIVPAAPSAKITMLNVKAFLEDGVYKPSDVAKKEGAKKESQTVIVRKIGRPKNLHINYEVTDRAPEKSSHDWRRVVAVFVTGATWQFKGWPFKGAEAGQTAEMFYNVLGIHISLKNEQLSDIIKTWNVQRYRLHPEDRHGDQSVVLEIFNAIDKFVANKGKR